MDLNAVVEVAIGLIFMWISLSLATIQIQEWWMTFLDKRARDMEAALYEMLANPNLKSQFYDHPVIRSLTARKRHRPSTVAAWFYRYPIVRGFLKEKRKLPSYIPSQNFALALFDITMTAGTESSLIQQGILKIRDDFEKEQSKPKDQAVIDALNILSDMAQSAAATEAGTSITNYTKDVLKREVKRLSDRYLSSNDENLRSIGKALSRALREASIIARGELEKVKQATNENAEESKSGSISPGTTKGTDPVLSELRQGVAALSVISPELNQTLSTLLLNVEEYTSATERQIANARENMESWFNNSMDRVSGVFKRYTQVLAISLGVILSLLLNVDTISVAQYLWREPAVRQVLVAQASRLQPTDTQSGITPQETVQQFTEQFGGLNLPIGWDLKKYGAIALYNSDCQLFPRPGQFFGIPVFLSNLCVTQSHSTDSTNIVVKLFGILITAGATAQGAPFWFDMLKKLVNLRGTGPNPAEKGAGK